MVRTRRGATTGQAEDNDSDGDVEIFDEQVAPPAPPARRPLGRQAFGAVDPNQGRKRKARQQPEARLEDKPRKRTRDTIPYDVDVDNRDDEQQATEYVVDLYKHYKSVEANWPVEAYIEFQQDINAKMRAVLVDWLVEVHLKFKMLQPTLYLTVQIIDRYLSSKQIHRKKLQLLGVSALFVACKYEEIYPPEVADFTYITDHAYAAEEVLDMEMKILLELDWKITAPNSHLWIERLCAVSRASSRVKHRAEYYSQRTLQEYALLEFKPSLIASAAVHLSLVAEARENRDHRECWPLPCEHLSGYTSLEIYACAKAISFHVNGGVDSKRRLVACKKKFSRHDFAEVSGAGRCPVLKRPRELALEA